MNKSRRMAALQARALSEAGISVLQIDLLGCGDSAGDFGDATWALWVDDVVAAARWLHARTGFAPFLWGLRSGCLLAAAAAAAVESSPDLVFWQPVISGRQHLQQFLRLRVASQLMGRAGADRTGTADFARNSKPGRRSRSRAMRCRRRWRSDSMPPTSRRCRPGCGSRGSRSPPPIRPPSRPPDSCASPRGKRQGTRRGQRRGGLAVLADAGDRRMSRAGRGHARGRSRLAPMNFAERPVLFECEGEQLVGVIALPELRRAIAVLVVVGGPQYRAGSHRQFVLLARRLAAAGFPVLRFDYRGMGDSTGAARTFEECGPTSRRPSLRCARMSGRRASRALGSVRRRLRRRSIIGIRRGMRASRAWCCSIRGCARRRRSRRRTSSTTTASACSSGNSGRSSLRAA